MSVESLDQDQYLASSAQDLEDIEDLFTAEKDVRPSRGKNIVIPKVRTKAKSGFCSTQASDEAGVENGERCFLPGQSRIYLKTWGCAHNSSDSEYMAGQLSAQGYVLTDDKSTADLWILNSCTVKNPAESHFQNEIESALKEGRKVIVSEILAGCVPQGKPDAGYIKGLSVIGVQQIDRVVEVVEETLKGNQEGFAAPDQTPKFEQEVRLLASKKVIVDDPDSHTTKTIKKAGGADLALPKVRRNPLIEIIAISTGCLNQCSYCKTKHARGELGSYPIEDIVERAKQSFDEGVVEIWLTSEDTGAYGRDIGQTLPDLLWRLVEVIPENCRLRLGMTNPPYILDHLDEIALILNHPRVFKFLHIPVQSGSDAVLSEMKREYTRSDFCHVIDTLRKEVPGLTVATDIICGFPTETEEDFEETFDLCSKYLFPSLFINQFYPRPGTAAAKMKLLPTNVGKSRTKRLTKLFQSYEPFKARIGYRYSILVTDLSHDKQYFVGHNEFYEQVLIPKREELMGKLVNVEIVGSTKFSMLAKVLVGDGSFSRPNKNEPLKTGQVSGVKTFLKEGNGKNFLIVKWSIVILFVAFALKVFQFLHFNLHE